MPFMRFSDTVHGAEARATFDIDGNIEFAFYIKSLEANFEKNVQDGKTLGKRSTQHKADGWTGTGTMTIYYVTSTFRMLAQKYAKQGRDTYFNITIENEDPATDIGKQTTVLYNCNLNTTLLAAIDVESAALEEDVEFTFDDFEILDQFGQATLS